MKKCLKTTLSMMLAFVLLLSVIPFGASAAETAKLTFTAISKNAIPGETVDVDIVMTNNPGIASIGMNIGYDSSILTVENITFNPEIGGTTQTSRLTQNPAKIIWISSTSDFQGDATIATITFRANASITENVSSAIELSYDPDDIYNLAEDNLDCAVVNGTVNVVAVVPGDINGDTKVNNKDVTRLLQYLAQWDVEVNTPALDTNGDGKINNKDVTRLMQFLAHWQVDLYPGVTNPVTDCHHQLHQVEAVAPSCEEAGNITYWSCSKCGKYYEDANAVREIKQENTVVAATGHTPEVIPAVPATYDSEGHTEGSRCSVCGTVLVAPQPIPPLEKDTYAVIYHTYEDDTYLQQIGVDNPNPDTYSSQDGLTLKNLKVDGYIFDGWYDGEGANGESVKTIPAGTKGEIELYARWRAREYTITFNSPLVPIPSKTYKVNTGATWTNPSLNGYNFIGWCDAEDKLVTSIPKGTTGNITLYANWTSKRNQTRPVSRLDDPIIMEDTDAGSILFAYEIGVIENVPLKALTQTYQSVGGMKQIFTTSETANVTKSEAQNIAKTVSNTATDSKAWTLSENWNDVTSVSESYAQQKGWTKEEAEQYSKTSSNTYSMNSSSGGSQTNTTTNGLSGTIAHSNSDTVGGSATHERETGSEFEVNGKVHYDAEAGIKAGIPGFGDASGKVSAGWEVGASYSNYDKNKDSVTMNYSNTGTDSKSLTASCTSASSGTSTWNTSSGFSASNSVSQTNSVRNVLSEVVSNTKQYGTSYARGGNKSDTQSFTNSTAESNQYSSAITFSEGTTTNETKTIELGGDNEGYYRFVLAGMAHVFAVVGYDVASSSYYVFNYTVMDDDTYTFIDYSKDTAAFNDNENGVLPFEVPYFVKEYVDARLTQTAGLSVSQEGIVTAYSGIDDFVFVPSYYRMDNLDGTYSSIKITGISPTAFAGKNIKAINLSNFVTEIPAGAFRNCTNLQAVFCPGVQTFGANAFDGCTSLTNFKVPSSVITLGNKAFNGVNSLTVDASTRSVALGAINSGADKVILNISSNPGAMADTEFDVPDSISYFELRGNAAEFTNVKVISAADTTVLNGLTIHCTKGIPLDISSPKVVLNRVNIDSKGFVAVLKSENTDIGLYGSIRMESASGKAIVCRSTALSEVDSTISSSLSVVGNIYRCGTTDGLKYLTISNGTIIDITEEEFEKYAKGCYEVTFNANGGTADTTTATVYYGTAYGTLPEPTLDYYNFDGWYTDAEAGEKVDENTVFEESTDVTLYAHWTEKPTSEWILVSDLPATAKVVDEKWSYTEREYSESGSSTKDGWTKYDTKVTGYGGTQGPVYSNPGGNNRKVWSEEYVSASGTRWHYSRSISGASGWNSYNVNISPSWGYLAYSQDITLDYKLDCTDSNWNGLGARYGKYYYNGFDCPYWFNEWSEYWETKGTRWYYQDPIYTYYYYRDVNKESASEITNGGNISNTQKWVKYIEK